MASNKNRKRSSADLIAEWNNDRPWVDSYTRDFQELDNLADAVALSRSKGAPIVGDVTLASAVRQIPRASIQQLPTFSVEVNGTKNSFHAIICDYIVRRIIFNEDTFGKGILSTMQIGAESALTHGFQVYLASVGGIADDFGTSLKLVHYNDFSIERGVFDFNESYKDKVRTRVTKSRLKKIIKSAKANPETTWDVSALEELLKAGPNASSDVNSKQSEPRYNISGNKDNNTFELITDYTNEPYGEITVFTHSIETPLRVFNSKSKFGYPRLSGLVIDPAQLTPFGVSRVRLASPAANFANIYLQSTAKMQLLNADPPVLQKGQFTTPIRLRRGALWQTLDTQADVKLQELSNSTLQQFENVLRFTDNQIYAIMGVTPGSVGAGQQSSVYQNATATGMEKNVADLANTQITHILENHLRQYALTGLDLFVSEQVGSTVLIVDDQAKDALNRLGEQDYEKKVMTGEVEVDPMTGMPMAYVPVVGDDNKVEITWEDFYKFVESWTVAIDLSMAKDTMEEKKRADLQDMLTVMRQTANPNDPNAAMRASEVEDMLIEKTLPELSRSKGQQAPQPLDPASEVTPAV